MKKKTRSEGELSPLERIVKKWSILVPLCCGCIPELEVREYLQNHRNLFFADCKKQKLNTKEVYELILWNVIARCQRMERGENMDGFVANGRTARTANLSFYDNFQGGSREFKDLVEIYPVEFLLDGGIE